MQPAVTIIYQFLAGEDGQTLSEYALILLLIALVMVAGLVLFGQQILAWFFQVVNSWP